MSGIGDLIRAAIRMCDAATRGYEAMADYYDTVSPYVVAAHEAMRRNQDSALLGNEAYVQAEKAREMAWIVGSVSGSVVEFHGAAKGEQGENK